MSIVCDIERLAQLLLKDKKINQEGFSFIASNFSKLNKTKSSRKKNGQNARKAGLRPNEAIDFITGLKVKLIGAKNKTVSEEEIMKSVAKYYKLRYKKLDPLDLNIDIVTNTIPKPFALSHMILPLYEANGILHIAIIDPEDRENIDAISRVTGKKVNPIISTPGEIDRIINEFFGFRSSVSKAEVELSGSGVDIGNLEQLNRIARPDQLHSNDEHIKNAVDYLFTTAFEMRASDIHIEPKRDLSLIRFRIDGTLGDLYSVPKGVHQAIASRIKMLSRMDIAEKRQPQDGRIRLEIGDSGAEVRVSTMPTAFGEKLVMRMLKPDALLISLESLGFFPEDLIKLEGAINKPHGIVLVTGPTGSGKTSTLYSALGSLSSPEKNIITIEDPIETICEDFNQVAIQPAIGLTFANALRTILRQDPDIIMVGEIRDSEAADNAMQAALTGHMVLSTLHTNDTASSVTRLIDLGVKPYLINAGLVCVLAQRLVKVVCEECAKKIIVSKKKLAQFGIDVKDKEVEIVRGAGCEECRLTGYVGRTAIFETLLIDEGIRRMILTNESPESMRKYALANGMTSLRENAIRKMLSGQTTMEEVMRIGHFL